MAAPTTDPTAEKDYSVDTGKLLAFVIAFTIGCILFAALWEVVARTICDCTVAYT